MKQIIIAGTNKAATTSLFNYLAEHPEVCGSNIKQTNYFLEEEVQKTHGLTSSYTYDDVFSNYSKFFNCNDSHSFKLEASPDYMYYKTAIDRLKSFSKETELEVIVILRNPVTRFKSWFNFGKQQALIDADVDYEAYYKLCKAYKGDSNLALMAYKTGFYSSYLEYMKKELKHVHILFYEDLVASTPLFVERVCNVLKIDSDFYKTYDFQHHNKTVKVKSKNMAKGYDFFRGIYIKYLYKGIGVKVGHLIRLMVSPLYKLLNTKKLSANLELDTVTENLKKDYEVETKALSKLFGINTPW